CSCHGLHGWVPVDERPTPSESVRARSWTLRSPRRSAASANMSQRPVRTSTSEAISSPTMCGSSSVPCAAACTSSKRLTRPSVAGSRSANSSSTATVKSGTVSNAARDAARSSSYPTFCSSPTTKRLVGRKRLQQELGDAAPAPLPLTRPPCREAEDAPLLRRQRQELAQALTQRRRVPVRKRRQVLEAGRILGSDTGGDLGEAGMLRHHRRQPRRGRLGRDHAER